MIMAIKPNEKMSSVPSLPANIECKISKTIKFDTYINVINKTGRDPRELLDMKKVPTKHNMLLHTILANIGSQAGYAYNVNGVWYKFYVISCSQNVIRVAQVIVQMPTLMPINVRYVDILFA